MRKGRIGKEKGRSPSSCQQRGPKWRLQGLGLLGRCLQSVFGRRCAERNFEHHLGGWGGQKMNFAGVFCPTRCIPCGFLRCTEPHGNPLVLTYCSGMLHAIFEHTHTHTPLPRAILGPFVVWFAYTVFSGSFDLTN